MSLLTEAYVANEKGKELVLTKVELPPLQDTQVEISISYCGLCHTDIHMINDDWKISNYPLVPGHEGVGTISATGAKVIGLVAGDAVGVGWIRDSCGLCGNCLKGRDNICEKGYQGTFLAQNAGVWGKEPCNMFGCFSKVVRIEARFAFKLPTTTSPENFAPLMCAGATTWEPIREYVQPGTKVGVRSIGGLGYYAIQFSNAIGAEVFALSHSSKKEQKIRALGVNHFILTTDEKQMHEIAGLLDVIIDTCPFSNGEDPIDLSPWMNLLSFGGTYCKIGVPSISFKYNFNSLIFTQKRIAGSIVCGSARTHEMLSVAATHKIQCDVEVINFDQINEAILCLLAGKNSRSRIVLKW
jgi:D-arabinose 1-dehydrogenase-like Zn-dependent alcohol dehydrogenase